LFRFKSLFPIPALLLLLMLSSCFSSNTAPTPASVSMPLYAESIDAAAAAHPLSIQALRSQAYPGSDFVIEQTLDAGSNYDRYIVSYRSEGWKIYALMTIPHGEKPLTGFPLVIFNHGYIPPAEYRTTERYVAYQDAFARNGYIVIKSDYRGHGSSEGQAEPVYGSAAYVVDVLNALASARRHPDVDPNRIGMWGHSMGGYITLRAMVVDPGIKAGVIWAGVVASYADLFESWFGPGSRPGWRATLIDEHGTPAENPAFWNALSANRYLTDLSGPIQLHHGTGDTTVPYEYSVMLDEEIRAVGGTVELFLYEGDDHNVAGRRDEALTLSVAFFHRYVR
jgi:uncharacterized protein